MIFIDIKWITMLLPWAELPQYPHADRVPKMTHGRLIRWHTSGFR